MKLIDQNRLLTDAEVEALGQTEEGWKHRAHLRFNARLGYAATQALVYLFNEKHLLARLLSETEENEFASILYYCLKKASDKEIDEHVENVWEMIQVKARQGGVPIFVHQIGNA